MFDQKDYDELIDLFHGCKEIGNEKQCNKIKRKLKINIENSFKEIQELIISEI